MKRIMAALLLVVLLPCFALSGDPDDKMIEEIEIMSFNAGGSDGSLDPEDPFAGIMKTVGNDAPVLTSFAVDGTRVWHGSGTELLCTDVATSEVIARAELEDLYEATGSEIHPLMNCVSLLQAEGGARLWIPFADGEDQVHVLLLDLSEQDGAITVRRVLDATDALAPLYRDIGTVYEFDLVSVGDSVCIAAMDSRFSFGFYLYTPGEKTVKPLMSGEKLSLEFYTATIPYSDSAVLIAGPASVEDLYSISLRLLDPFTDEIRTVGSFRLPADDYAENIAYSAESDTLFFSLDSTAYHVAASADAAEASAFFILQDEPNANRLGTVADGQYIIQSIDEELILCDMKAEITSVQIRIGDTEGLEALTTGAAAFNRQNPDYLVSVRSLESTGAVTEALMNRSTDYDAYTVSMTDEAFEALTAKGYMAPMNGSAVLTEAVADMPDRIRQEIFRNGDLIALPMACMNECIGMNSAAMAAASGVPEADLPTDWTGFLQLLGKIAEGGTLAESGEYILYGFGCTADEFREQILSWILNDCYLWLRRDGSRLSRLGQVLIPILRAMEDVQWERLGFSESGDYDMSWFFRDQQNTLLSDMNPEIAAAADDGTRAWPLSLEKNGERLIGQYVSALFINPFSPNTDAVLRYAESVWEEMNEMDRITLCRSMNDPVVNATFEDDMRYFTEMLEVYETAIANAETREVRDQLSAERDEIAAFSRDYEENAHWLASAESIAAYRALEEQMQPAGPSVWDTVDSAAPQQYLAGTLPAEQFANQLASTLQMQLLEGY